MRFRLLVCLVCLLSLVTACQETPQTVVVLVLTATPDGNGATEDANSQASATALTRTPAPPTATSTPSPTPTPDPRPTPTIDQIQVAEQPFEHGRMFWVQPTRQIWVMHQTEENGGGTWTIYEDTYTDDEPETDPSLVPPSDNLYQPSRGFGKLWRENEDVREALGWAITPTEFGYISRYEYHPGGTVTTNNTYVTGPGYHILFSLYEEAFRFNEADQSWQPGRGN